MRKVKRYRHLARVFGILKIAFFSASAIYVFISIVLFFIKKA